MVMVLLDGAEAAAAAGELAAVGVAGASELEETGVEEWDEEPQAAAPSVMAPARPIPPRILITVDALT
jgi:hypothetical protein